MARTEARHVGGPGELVDVRGCPRRTGVGEPVQRHPQQMVGDHLPDEVRGARPRMDRAIAAGHLVAAAAAGHGTGQGDGTEPVDALQQTSRGQPQPVLLAGPAQQQFDVGRAAFEECLHRVARDEVAVDDDPEGGPAEDRAAEPGHVGLGAQQQGAVHCGERPRRRRDLQPGGHPAHHAPYLVALARLRRSALQDGPPEQALGPRACQQRPDADGPGRLTEHGHPVRVAAEPRDRLPHPLQRGELVAQPGVGRRVREESVTLHTQPVVDRDEDDTVACEGVAVVDGHGRRAAGQGAAVDPHHDGQPGPGAGLRCPDVQVETVVAGHHGVGEQPCVRLGVRGLGRRRPELPRVTHTVPGLGRDGWPEAAGAERRGRVGNAAEDGDPVLVPAAHRSVGSGDHRVVRP
ncbi:hypothetical protein BX281_3362 [Streptomyces sp. Ag82_O1-15]|nr:hypothetical protein BX281_3362 [Streptomyces sp. Ag82_O1-15]